MSNHFYNNNIHPGQQQFIESQNTHTTFNANRTHPLIQSSQEYIFYKKYISIHSEDRDCLKYPSSSDFEIELPEDLLNVASLRLYEWSFPCNYSTFSDLLNNTKMTFKINNPYNPNINSFSDLLTQKIFECLFKLQDFDYTIYIENGFYSPQQMATELTNKFNTVVTNEIVNYFNLMAIDPTLTPSEQQTYIDVLELFNNNGGYNNFVIVYNIVGIKLWFGNTSDGFILTTENQFLTNNKDNISILQPTNNSTIKIPNTPYSVPDYSSWGLPGYLGLSRCNTTSISGSYISTTTNISNYNSQTVPRFYYGDVMPGDNGYWLLPNSALPGSEVHWVESPSKINIMGQAYIYMEIDGQNCIDETKPYNISPFTMTTNQTNGVVNSAFAKIPIPSTPLSQWFDYDRLPYKYYYPPAERMRKFHIRFRYHNGELVDFGNFNHTFTLEFTLQVPQILRGSVNTKLYPPLI